MYKKTLVFDFDGVIHSYKSKWKGATIVCDEPVSGIKEVIDELKNDFNVVIVSTRCFQDGGIEAIKSWLFKYNIEVDGVLGEKPPAIVYVDDRAICFNGNTKGLVNQIKTFKNWLEKETETDINKKNESKYPNWVIKENVFYVNKGKVFEFSLKEVINNESIKIEPIDFIENPPEILKMEDIGSKFFWILSNAFKFIK